MRAQLWRYVRDHHVGLVAVGLIVTGGTAYAAGLAPNSVGSPQIKNGQVRSIDVANNNLTGTDIRNSSLTGADIRDRSISGADVADGTLGGADLADGTLGAGKLAAASVTAAKIADGAVTAAKLDPTSVGDIISTGKTFPADGTQRPILIIPGFGTLKGSCSSSLTKSVFYELQSTVTQRAHVFGHDAIGGDPSGAAQVNGSAGGVGFGGSNVLVLEATYTSFTTDRFLRMDVMVSLSGGDCDYRVRATIDRNDP